MPTCVGKESNRLEEVEAGLGHDPDEVYAEYADPGRDPWRALVLPVLLAVPSKVLAEVTALSTRSIREIRNGHSRPRSTGAHWSGQRGITLGCA